MIQTQEIGSDKSSNECLAQHRFFRKGFAAHHSCTVIMNELAFQHLPKRQDKKKLKLRSWMDIQKESSSSLRSIDNAWNNVILFTHL